MGCQNNPIFSQCKSAEKKAAGCTRWQQVTNWKTRMPTPVNASELGEGQRSVDPNKRPDPSPAPVFSACKRWRCRYLSG